MNESSQNPLVHPSLTRLGPTWLPLATALGLSVVVLTTGADYAGDDAFILLTYARHLTADGNARGTPSLAHYEVGTLGYHKHRTRIIDLGGLVTARPSERQHQGAALTAAILRAERPSHLLRPSGAPERITVGDMTFRRILDSPPRSYTPFSLYRRVDYRPNRRANRPPPEERPP